MSETMESSCIRFLESVRTKVEAACKYEAYRMAAQSAIKSGLIVPPKNKDRRLTLRSSQEINRLALQVAESVRNGNTEVSALAQYDITRESYIAALKRQGIDKPISYKVLNLKSIIKSVNTDGYNLSETARRFESSPQRLSVFLKTRGYRYDSKEREIKKAVDSKKKVNV